MKYLVVGLCAAIAGAALTYVALTPPPQAVYLIGAVSVTDAERLPEYQAIAGPLAAAQGGYVPLAFGSPQMLEGLPPTDGWYFVERYDSEESLQRFLNDPAFTEAKVLRDEVADVHFMLAVPAYRHTP